MNFFSSKRKKQTLALLRAVTAGDADAVALAVASGADVNGKDSEGIPVLRHAIRNEKLSIIALLLDHGAKPTVECAGSVALWAERADRAVRSNRPNAKGGMLRVKTAVRLMEMHHAPWDGSIKSLGSGDSVRQALIHVLPGCLSDQPR